MWYGHLLMHVKVWNAEDTWPSSILVRVLLLGTVREVKVKYFTPIYSDLVSVLRMKFSA